MARPTTGSMKIRANTNASTPASAPASRPRAITRFCIFGNPRSVAGEAEEMAGVVDELVDVGVATEDGGSTLIDPDEIQHDEGQENGARQPEGGAHPRQIDGGSPALAYLRRGHVDFLPGDLASQYQGDDGCRV